MATYTSTMIDANQVYTPPVGGGVFVREVTFEATTALALNDVIELLPINKGERVVDLQLLVDDLDSGTTIVLDVGDGVDRDRYIDGSTIGQTGGFVRMGQGVAAAATFNMDYTYPAADTIDVLVAVAPTGGGVGTIKMRAFIVAS